MFTASHPTRSKLIDFQLVHYAPAAEDVAFLLYACTSSVLPNAFQHAMISSYHEKLEEVVMKNNASVQVPTMERLLADVEEYTMALTLLSTFVSMETLIGGPLALKIKENFAKYDRSTQRAKLVELWKQSNGIERRAFEGSVKALVKFSQRLWAVLRIDNDNDDSCSRLGH